MADARQRETFEGWCILELMGHKRIAGQCREVTIAGSAFLRIDIPAKTGTVTQIYGASAIYCITPTSEELARAAAQRIEFVPPISQWELRPQLSSGASAHDEDVTDSDETPDGPDDRQDW